MKTQKQHIGTSNKPRVISINGSHGAHQGFSVESGETYTFEKKSELGNQSLLDYGFNAGTSPNGKAEIHGGLQQRLTLKMIDLLYRKKS